MKKVALVSGASGLVGSELIELLLKDDYYDQVVAVVRKPVEIINAKLVQKIIDFEKIPSVLGEIKADDGFCCLGTTIKSAGSQERQYRIDHDYVVEFGKAAFNAGVRQFAVVSSIGSDKDSKNFYLRTKGAMEEDLKKIAFEALYIMRPSFLLGKRKEFRFGEKAGLIFLYIFQPFMLGRLRKYRGIKAQNVAKGMIERVKSDKKGTNIIESDNI
jgi:uncharacterized protein YbjT (DUF2867 family)